MPTAIASRRSAKFAAASVLLLVFAASTASTVSAAGAGTGTGLVPPPSDIRGPLFDAQSFQCEQQVQATAEALVQCTLRNPLWAHMVAFQNIADSNPGPDGFASRNIGEPGYLASALRDVRALRFSFAVLGLWFASVVIAIITLRPLTAVAGALAAVVIASLALGAVRRDLRSGCLSVAVWHLTAGGLVAGLLRPRRDPKSPIGMRVIACGERYGSSPATAAAQLNPAESNR